MDILNIQGNIAKAVESAPMNFLKGLSSAVMVLPNGIKGIWTSWTPEQQATVEQAVAKLLLELAEAYVGSK